MIYRALRKHLGAIFRELTQQRQRKAVEGHFMNDHVDLHLSLPPRGLTSNVVDFIKRKSAISTSWHFRNRQRNFTAEVFGPRGYFDSTVGLDKEIGRAHICNQEKEDDRYDQML